MNIFGKTISTADFIPPIINKIQNKVHHFVSHDKRVAMFKHCPPNIDVQWIIDVGANNGMVAKAALDSYPESSIICFEPVRSTFEKLRCNLSEYGERVHLYNAALSDHDGLETINITSSNAANSLERQASFHKRFNPHICETGTETIQVMRLDEAAGLFSAKKVQIVKIDVEGHELKVLKGGTNFLRACVDIIIIEIALQRDNSLEHQALFEIFSLLEELGFRLINIFDLHHANDSELQLTQMDCIFRKFKYLRGPTI